MYERIWSGWDDWTRLMQEQQEQKEINTGTRLVHFNWYTIQSGYINISKVAKTGDWKIFEVQKT